MVKVQKYSVAAIQIIHLKYGSRHHFAKTKVKLTPRSHHNITQLYAPINETIKYQLLHLTVEIQSGEDFKGQGHYGKVTPLCTPTTPSNVPIRYQLPTPSYSF